MLGFCLSLLILESVSIQTIVAFESFGIAALLYLAVEELLVEAHDVAEDLPWIFLGFLVVMLCEML